MVDLLAIGLHDGIRDAHVELALDDALQVNLIGDQFVGRCDLAGEFYFTRAQGTTTTVDRTAMQISENAVSQDSGESFTVLDRGTTVSEVAKALNLLGASPRDIIAIFQAIKEAGALHAELRIM